MKEKELFQTIRKKRSKFTLRAKLTFLIGTLVLVSIGVSWGIEQLLELLFPVLADIPDTLKIIILSLVISVLLGRIFIKFFSDPIQELREGMYKVADGDFTVQLDVGITPKELKEVIAGFNMMTKELQSTEILQSDFISNVSHEFKTPINAIEGYTTLLQGTDNIDEVENDYIEKILFSTRQLSSLVNNILLLSKMENQSIGAVQEYYAVDEQIRQVIATTGAEWEAKDIDMDADLAETRFYGCPQRLYHVWSNIIGNAIKFSPRGGAIKIRLYEKESKLYFTVEDQGPGLSEEAKKHLFDKFYQGDHSHEQEGNGLGLALVKRILTVSEDEIYAENIEGGGCKFTVVLKCTEPNLKGKNDHAEK